MIDAKTWAAFWQELGAPDGAPELHRQLVKCWSEKHRHYHTLQHLRECFERFEELRGDAKSPPQIAVALWFHDGFYDPTQCNNEARSADWARNAALESGIGGPIADKLHAMVMATKHHGMPEDADTRLLVDIDLAIFGADVARFDESNAQVRREYAHVPEAEWLVGRGRVLRQFLERDRLYGTQRFHDMYEERARQNIRRALDRLGA